MRSPEAALAPADIVRSGLCIGCGSCAASGRADGAAMVWDRNGHLKPSGSRAFLRTPSESFARICPFSPRARDEDALAEALYGDVATVDPRIGRYDGAYVGHVGEGEFRAVGSSGGMVSWVAAELMRRGLVDAVAHVAAVADPQQDGRFFRYRVSRSEEEVRSGAKSRYYPIELSEVIETIRTVPGRYAVIGVPCFIKAINLLRLEDPVIGERVAFTLGLFCGHMKSAHMVDSFAWQMGAEPDAVRAIDFRLKDPGRPANWYRTELRLDGGDRVAQDWWHLAEGDWGSGFFQNSACNYCDDVVAETADISFGDAWVEPYSSDGWGTNVVVVRSKVVHALVSAGVDEGRLALSPVDADFVAQTQAAGLRHRREGLAWRLARKHTGVRPRKRVAPRTAGIPRRRRFIYWMRAQITRGSPLAFRLASRLRSLPLYTGWAKGMLALYHGLAYSRGRVGAAFDRFHRLFGNAEA